MTPEAAAPIIANLLKTAYFSDLEDLLIDGLPDLARCFTMEPTSMQGIESLGKLSFRACDWRYACRATYVAPHQQFHTTISARRPVAYPGWRVVINTRFTAPHVSTDGMIVLLRRIGIHVRLKSTRPDSEFQFTGTMFAADWRSLSVMWALTGGKMNSPEPEELLLS